MQTLVLTRKQRFADGFFAGLFASLPTSLLMMILSLFGGVSLPDQVASAISVTLPPPAFEYLHTLFGDAAKEYLLVAVLIGQCLVFALGGGLYHLLLTGSRLTIWRDERGQLRLVSGVVLALVLWLFTGLLFLPLLDVGIFGALLPSGWFGTAVSLAIEGLVFGLLFMFSQRWLVVRAEARVGEQTEERVEAQRRQRRGLFVTGLKVLGLGTVGVLAWRFITVSGSSSTAPAEILTQGYKPKITPPQPNYGELSPVEGLTAEVTPTSQFYVVSKNFTSDPTVDGTGWQLKVDGLVEQPYMLTYAQISALAQKKQSESMMCISNPVGGNLMSSALWEGVPMADLLQRAGQIRPGATKIVLHGADGYTDSIHLSKALEPTTFVALRMNGATLPDNHGYPARVLVPGIYGMKHIKWLQRIEVVDTDYQGYWQKGGWSDPAPIRLTTRIDVPNNGSQVAADKPQYVAGIAFSGNKGISQVNVSVDGGKTWQQALLKPPLSALTWVLWELPWQPVAQSHTIIAYAVDKEGNVQDPQHADSLPDGASGYHTVTVVAK
jgi:DMSO/TMAO reductase YedYZ molybdopterin-dependent catalytic subunit